MYLVFDVTLCVCVPVQDVTLNASRCFSSHQEVAVYVVNAAIVVQFGYRVQNTCEAQALL